MGYNTILLNQICTDLGITAGHEYDVQAYNAICTYLGITAGHEYSIYALNAIAVYQGLPGGYEYNIDALNAICKTSYEYEDECLALLGAQLNYTAEYKTVLAAFPTQPNATDKAKQNAWLKAMVDGGYYAKAEYIKMFSIADSDSACIDFKHPGTFTAIPVSSPVFTAYEGFKGNNAGGKCVNLNFNPATDKILTSQSSICVIIGVGDDVSEDLIDFGAKYLGTTLEIISRWTDGYTYFKGNSGIFRYKANTNAKKHFALSRGNSANYDIYLNYTKENKIDTSVAEVDNDLYCCGVNTDGVIAANNKTIRYAFAFEYLTEAEVKDVIGITEDYLKSVGTNLMLSVNGNTGVLGDSTIAPPTSYPTLQRVANYLSINGTLTDIATTGDKISDQKTKWQAIDSAVRLAMKYVFVQIGLNDVLTTTTTTAAAIAAYQDLIDTIKTDAPNSLIVAGTMTPCKSYMISALGAINGAIAYQKWIDINIAIKTTITGINKVAFAHTDTLNDGDGNLLAIYDAGDTIHTNDLARSLNSLSWYNSF